ncbi:MAG: hypothetical protein JWR23_561 [Mucilaginibacter sp.]|nr:hypothetical protein [Mucilaginibacter sp.]
MLYAYKRVVMKHLFLTVIFFLNISAFAQKHTPLPHGMVFGVKPNITAMVDATKVEALMGKRTRINTTIRGWVTKVTKQKGGWFELDAGKGKIIAAHFKSYTITIPAELKGKIVIAEGIAEKKFMADDLQHFAGDTVSGKKQHMVKTDPKRRLIFEVKGLMVDQ